MNQFEVQAGNIQVLIEKGEMEAVEIEHENTKIQISIAEIMHERELIQAEFAYEIHLIDEEMMALDALKKVKPPKKTLESIVLRTNNRNVVEENTALSSKHSIAVSISTKEVLYQGNNQILLRSLPSGSGIDSIGAEGFLLDSLVERPVNSPLISQIPTPFASIINKAVLSSRSGIGSGSVSDIPMPLLPKVNNLFGSSIRIPHGSEKLSKSSLESHTAETTTSNYTVDALSPLHNASSNLEDILPKLRNIQAYEYPLVSRMQFAEFMPSGIVKKSKTHQELKKMGINVAWKYLRERRKEFK